MKITKTNNNLIVTDKSTFPTVAAAIAGAFVLYGLLKSIIQKGITHIDSVAFSVGLLFFIIIYIKFKTVTKIVFDSDIKTITWEKRRILKNDSGQINFNDVKQVRRDMIFDEDNNKIYRVVIITKDFVLPITDYYGVKDDLADETVNTIRRFMELK